MKEYLWEWLGRQMRWFVLSLFFFGIFIPPTWALSWKELPEFPQARLIRQSDITKDNQLGRMRIYSAQAKRSEIIDFYKKELFRAGWKLEQEQVPQNMNLLLFSCEGQQLVIMLQKISGELFISVLQNQLQDESAAAENACPECQEKLKALTKESEMLSPQEYQAKVEEIYKEMAEKKKESILNNDSPGEDLEFVPRYPESVRISSVKIDGGKNVNLAYLSQDSQAKIEDFYLQAMTYEGWGLDREVDLQNLPADFLKGLKTEPPQGKSLIFKGPMGRCAIIITEHPGIVDAVMIGVRYNAR